MSFAEALLDAARPFDMAASPFVQRVQRAEASRASLSAWAAQLYVMSARFPRNLEAILDVCDDVRVRHFIAENIAEEEGHPALAERFARAAGANAEDLLRANVEPSRWFRAAVESRNWIGATAFFGVGLESNVPRTFALLLPPLEQMYGFSRRDLAFLTLHLEADERHGSETADLVAAASSSPARQAQALEGARRGGMSWWMFHKLAG